MSERSDPGREYLRREVPAYGFYSQGSDCRNVLNSQRLESSPPPGSSDLSVQVGRKWKHATSPGNEASASTNRLIFIVLDVGSMNLQVTLRKQSRNEDIY